MAIDDQSDVRELIREAFACSEEIAGVIFGRGTMRAYGAHAVIVRQGEEAAFAYLLTLGRAHALRYGIEGQVILLCEYLRGDLFGAVGGPNPLPPEAEIRAVEASRSFLLGSRDLVALVEAYGSIGLALTRFLVRQLQQANSWIYLRSAVSATGRVRAEISQLGRASPDFVIRPAPVISELAVRASTTRETASRAVSALERRGIIRRDPDSWTVVAPQRLEEMII